MLWSPIPCLLVPGPQFRLSLLSMYFLEVSIFFGIWNYCPGNVCRVFSISDDRQLVTLLLCLKSHTWWGHFHCPNFFWLFFIALVNSEILSWILPPLDQVVTKLSPYIETAIVQLRPSSVGWGLESSSLNSTCLEMLLVGETKHLELT